MMYSQVLALLLLAPAALAFHTPKPLTAAPKTSSSSDESSKPTSTTLFGDGSWYSGPYTPSYYGGGGYGRSYGSGYGRGYNSYYDDDYYGDYDSYGYGNGYGMSRRYNDYDSYGSGYGRGYGNGNYYYGTGGRYSSWRPAYRGPLAPDNFDYSSDTVGGRRLFDNDNRYRLSREGGYYADSPYYSRSGRNYYDNFARNSNYYGDRGNYNGYGSYSGYGMGSRYGNGGRYGNYYINDYNNYGSRYNRLGAYAYSE
jgi:hypothetical protein